VTGASSGVGRRMAERLAGKGATLGLLGRDESRLEETAASCRRSGAGAVACSAGDVSVEADVDRAFATFERDLGATDILANCAGISLPDRIRLEDIPSELWRTMFDTNVLGTYLTCRRALPGMKARGSGFVVNIGSTGAHVALPGVSSYAASKFAVRALTDSMLQECEGLGIRVCLVSAGPINTPTWDKMRRPAPMPRDAMLQPDDIADAAIWLLERPTRVRCDEILLRPVRKPQLDF